MRLKTKLIGSLQLSSEKNGGKGIANSISTSMEYYNKTDFYKVPFTDVLALVSRREVYLEAGFAYVSRSKILSIVEGKFRASLSKSLTRAYQMKFRWSDDARIASIVNRLSKVAFQYGGSAITGRDALLSSNNNPGLPFPISKYDIEQLSKSCLCRAWPLRSSGGTPKPAKR